MIVVEDNDDDFFLLERAFHKSSIAGMLIRARSGTEALAELGMLLDSDPERPLCLLVDLKMPGVDGFGLLQCIRSEPRTRRIPVIILSSSDSPKDLARAYDLGANSYVVKPLTFDGFKAVTQAFRQWWVNSNWSSEPSISA